MSRDNVSGRSTNVRVWSKLVRRAKRGHIDPKTLAILKENFWENTHSFAENTTLHGLKFVGNKNISLFERIFFLIAFVIALALAANFIYDIYSKWPLTPVIIANSATSTYISQIPFPAVTICNMNQALKSKVSRLDRNSPAFSILQTLCARESNADRFNVSNKWNDIENFILESTQRCSEMLLMCKYASFTVECSSLFKPILTDEGRCCVFNTVDSSFMYLNYSVQSYDDSLGSTDRVPVDWTPEFGYPKQLPEKYYPSVALGTGYSVGLTVILNADVKEYYCSSANGAGFKVRLHSPIEVPNVGDDGFSIQAGYETRIVITPQRADASETIRDMSIGTRQCVYGSEVKLSYFRTYSRRNCEIECEAHQLARECNCIMYYMPRISTDIAICSVHDRKCYQKIITLRQTVSRDKDNCSRQCIAGCFDLTYDTDTFASPISQGSFAIREKVIQKMSPGFAGQNIAVAHFYYIENAFRSRTKEQFVGFTEFLSSTGGLMGLFVGFSLISVVEVIYYMTFRPYCASRRRNKHINAINPNAANKSSIITFWKENFGKKLQQNIPARDDLWHGRKYKRMHGFNEGHESQLTESVYLP